MRLLPIFVACSLALGGCSLVYKLPTRQGNVIEQEQLDQLETGMTRDQVKFLLGTPLSASPFVDDRWDYLGYYKSPRGKESRRVVSLYFDGNTLTRMEGTERQASNSAQEPDVEQVIEQENIDEREQREERDTGITINQSS